MAEENTQAGRQTQRRRQSALRSDVWVHFARFEDNGHYKARCKRCYQVLSAKPRNGTSSLSRHVLVCRGQEGGAARQRLPPPCAPSRSAASSDPEPSLEDEASEDLARMIVFHGYDPSFVEDHYFRSFLRHLNPQFKVPTRLSIEKMCDGIFYGPWFHMILRLIFNTGRVSLIVGKATTLEGEVLYTACHFIDDEFKFIKLVLDAYLVAPPGGYHGPILGVHEVSLKDVVDRIMFDIEHEHDILRRLFMMPQTITDDGIHLKLKNRIEQELSSDTSPTSRKLTCTAYMDQVLHSIARCLLPSKKFTEDMLINKKDLYLMREDRQELLSHLDLDDPLEYHECWYSCYCSLRVLHEKGLPSTSVGRDTEVTGLLCKIWGQIFRAIKRISTSSSPTSNLCLTELLNLRGVLQSELVREPDFFCDGKNVADVLREALHTLDNAIQDSYLVWSIPLVLDPRYKIEFIKLMFEKAVGCEAAGSYISEVRRKITELYTDYHSGKVGTSSANHSDGVNEMAISSANRMEQDWHEHYSLNHAMTTVVSCHLEAGTELDCYLEDRLVPPTTVGFDILNWWKVNSSWYPTVARIARDALAMPTCSKLSSEQLGQVRSIVHGYSDEPFIASSFKGAHNEPFVTSSSEDDAHDEQFVNSSFGAQSEPVLTSMLEGDPSVPFVTSSFGGTRNEPYVTSSFGGAHNEPYGTSSFGGAQNEPFATSSFGNSENELLFATSNFGDAHNEPIVTSSFRANPNVSFVNASFERAHQETFVTSIFEGVPSEALVTSSFEGALNEPFVTSGFEGAPDEPFLTSSFEDLMIQ